MISVIAFTTWTEKVKRKKTGLWQFQITFPAEGSSVLIKLTEVCSSVAATSTRSEEDLDLIRSQGLCCLPFLHVIPVSARVLRGC